MQDTLLPLNQALWILHDIAVPPKKPFATLRLCVSPHGQRWSDGSEHPLGEGVVITRWAMAIAISCSSLRTELFALDLPSGSHGWQELPCHVNTTVKQTNQQ